MSDPDSQHTTVDVGMGGPVRVIMINRLECPNAVDGPTVHSDSPRALAGTACSPDVGAGQV